MMPRRPDRTSERVLRRRGVAAFLDTFFFVFAGLAAVWLAVLNATQTFDAGWWGIVLVIAFWVLLAYLVLPRLHRILTAVYVPEYFIGRARTSDGLLGDPINLALMGTQSQLTSAFTNAGWVLADPVTVRSSFGIIRATLTRRSYDQAPVSPLYLFGRHQDFAYQQEVDGNPAQRHHVRVWRCPPDWPLPGGRRVHWLAAATFDRSVGLSLFTLQITHKIDADTDVERDHVVETLTGAESAATVATIRDFSAGYHARNGGGDTIRTDGDLPIVDLRAIAVAPLASETAEVGAVGAEPESDNSPSDGMVPDDAGGGSPVVRKRPAFESASRALAAPPGTARMRRPAALSAGCVLILLRIASGVLWLSAFSRHGAGALTDTPFALGGVPEDDHSVAVSSVVIAGAVALAIELILIAFVYLGNNLARLSIMAVSVASTMGAFVGWVAHGQEITLHTTLLTVGLDVLVLLALSARSSSAYARRRQAPVGSPA